MSSTHRHDRTVAAIADAAGTVPITRADLPPFAPERLELALRAADEAAEVAVERRDAAARQLDETRAEIERLDELAARHRDEHERAAARVAATSARLDEERDALVAIRADRDVAAEILEQHTSRAATALHLRGALATVVAAVSAGPLDDPTKDEVAGGLRHTLVDLAELGLDDRAGAVTTWADQLEAGTAALDPAARTLLEDLDDLDRRWTEAGSGEPAADERVIAARQELLASQEAVAQLESQARSGNLGERLRRVIEQAHATRVGLEERGRRAHPDEVVRAREAEDEALALVGFDSMLDFRVAMSTAGSGALAESRRRTCEARLADATAGLEQELDASRRRHDELGARRDELEQRLESVVPGCAPTDRRAALGRLFAVPEPVRGLLDELDVLIADTSAAEGEARLRCAELSRLEHDHALALRDIEEQGRHAASVAESARNECSSATDRARAHEALLERLGAQLAAAEVRVAAADDARSALERRGYTPDDVTGLRDALVELAGRRTAEGARCVVDDPTEGLDEDDAVTVVEGLLGAELGGRVDYVTSRREVLRLERRPVAGPVRLVDGRRRSRRRLLRFGATTAADGRGASPERSPSWRGRARSEAQHG